MSELRFNSSLSIEEIERNFEGVDVFAGIVDGLNEALAHARSEDVTTRKTSLSDQLVGVLPSDVDEEAARQERMERHKQKKS